MKQNHAGKHIIGLLLTFYLLHFDQETINEVPRIVHVLGCLVFLYFLQNIIFYISKIFKYFIMIPWEIINESREIIADLKDEKNSY